MKMWYTQYRILFTLKKSHEMFSKQMELENITPSKVIQIDKSCIVSLISESQIWIFLCEYIETEILKMVMVPSESHGNLQTTQTVARQKVAFCKLIAGSHCKGQHSTELTECGEIKLILKWTPQTHVLVSLVQEGTLRATERETWT